MLENLDLKLSIPPEQLGNVTVNLQAKMLGALLTISQQLTNLIALNAKLNPEGIALMNQLNKQYEERMQFFATELSVALRAKFGQ